MGVSRKILIVRGHPDPQGGHFCDALVTAYRDGAETGGHRVRTVDIARLDLPYLRSDAEWKRPAPNEAIRAAQAEIARAEHLVFVYPLWLGDMPAMLKSFLEQISCDGFVLSSDEKGRWRQGLAGKSARIIVTMGMPALAYRWFYLAHSLRSFERNILKFAGVRPVRSTIIGSIDRSQSYRQGWLKTIQELGNTAS